MKILLILTIAFVSLFSEKPASETRIFLEDGSGRNLIAFQQAGNNGKATFKYLDAGSYQLLIEFPQQNGKWLKEKRKNLSMTKASYNPKSKTYFYQGPEGYFSIKINTNKVDKDDFSPLFQEKRTDEGVQIVISRFLANKNQAQISVLTKAITSAQFKRAVDKIGKDLSMISIQNIK